MCRTIFIIFYVFLTNLLAENLEFKMKYDPNTQSMQPEHIGVVIFARKETFKLKQQNDKLIPIKKGADIDIGDSIQTKKKSILKIRLVDDTVISFGPNTTLNFTSYNFRSKKDRTSVYSLVNGRMRAMFKHAAKPGDLTIKAGSVSMGIRGTELLTNVLQKEDETVTQIALLKGKLQVDTRSLSINQDKIIMKPGDLLDTKYATQHQLSRKFIIKLKRDQFNELKIKGKSAEDNIPPFLHFNYRKVKRSTPNPRQRSNEKQQRNNKSKQKNWSQILREEQSTPSGLKADIDEVKMENTSTKEKAAPIKCRYYKECLEHNIHEIRGKKVTTCQHEKIVKYPAGCVE